MIWGELIEAAIISLSLSFDVLVTAFAYGGSGICVPMKSVNVINAVGMAVLLCSLALGLLAKGFVPVSAASVGSFIMLFALGFAKLLNGVSKSLIRRFGSIKGAVDVRLFNFRFMLNVYSDPEAADVDHSKTISPKEALTVAVALSLDCGVAGFGAVLGGINILALILLTFTANFAALIIGLKLGKKLIRKTDISWLGGVLLIALAFWKLC